MVDASTMPSGLQSCVGSLKFIEIQILFYFAPSEKKR